MSQEAPTGRKRTLGVFMLGMMTFSILANLRGVPSLAELGLSAIFFIVIAAITFLVPTALVSAELATGWPEEGGVYIWVKEAFNDEWAFAAGWLQWMQNNFWYPTVLTFTAASIAFIFDPGLAGNKIFTIVVVFVVFWGATLANFRGMKIAGLMASAGSIVGTLIPGVALIIMAIVWLVQGRPTAVALDVADIIPHGSIDSFVLAAGAFTLFIGVEVTASNALDVKKTGTTFPRATFLAAGLAAAVYILTTLAISIVVPQTELGLASGVVQAFRSFFGELGLEALTPIFAGMIAIGAIGQISTWLVGPTRGLMLAARDGTLPKRLRHTNSAGIPTAMLVVQGVITSGVTLLFLVVPTVSTGFWILTILSTQIYLVMYAIMYAAAIRLRYKCPDVRRDYTIPGGKPGIWLVGGLGTFMILVVILIGFFPPEQIETGNPVTYYSILLFGFFALVLAPFVVYRVALRRRRRRPATIRSQAETPTP